MRARLEMEEVEKRLDRKELIDARVRYAFCDQSLYVTAKWTVALQQILDVRVRVGSLD